METYSSGGVPIRIAESTPRGKGPHPALVILHGAGGNLSYWLHSIGEKVAAFGIATFAPHYFNRTGTQRADAATILDGRHFPLWLETARDAITYVAARPEIDARRIGVLGISLGGYLALAMAVEDPRLAAVVELSGGMPASWTERVHAGMPPVLLLHGEADTVVPVTEAHKAVRVLKEAGNSPQLKLFPGQGHWLTGAAQLEAMLTTAQFLSRHLGGPKF